MKIIDQLKHFESISLDEMEDVSFMKRTDTKYVFHVSRLNNLLETLQNRYRALEIGSKKYQEYVTLYYDTSGYRMYHDHLHGKLNRYKIRSRHYLNSNDYFVEIKFKSNRFITSKKRLLNNENKLQIKPDHSSFIALNSNLTIEQLHPASQNRFSRITLVQPTIPERLTLDTGLSFFSPDQSKSVNLENLCILEVKRERTAKNHELDRILHELGIYPNRFSKYCMGIAFLNSTIKKNRFKPRILRVKKLNNNR